MRIFLFGFCLLSAGCIPAPKYDSEFEAQFRGQDQSAIAKFASGYFPEAYGEPSVDYCSSDAGPWPLVGEFEEDWYPEQWMAAREPSFFLLSEQKSPPEFALRFSYIPSFSPSIFIRIHKVGESYVLVAKRMDGAGGYEPGSIASSKEISLSRKEVAEFRRLLSEEALFEEQADPCSRGFDGSEWLFELVDPQGYRMVKRWSPTDGAGYELGQHLLHLVGWNIEELCWHPLPYPFADVGLLCR